MLYGAMPNMGLYYTPDGPFTNPADLLRMMKMDEAREEEMQAAELCMEDMIYVCKRSTRSAPTASTSTPRPRPATPTSGRP